MITQDDAWARLIVGLAKATQRGALKWTETSSKVRPWASALPGSPLFQTQRSFEAMHRSGSFDLRGFEEDDGISYITFDATELVGLISKPLGSVIVNLDEIPSERTAVQELLMDLYITVDRMTESSEAIVDRLLGGL